MSKTFVEVWRDEWRKFVGHAVPFFFDAALAFLVCATIIAFGLLLKRATVGGWIDEDHAKHLETAHFWITFAAYVMSALFFLVRLAVRLFLDIKSEARGEKELDIELGNGPSIEMGGDQDAAS